MGQIVSCGVSRDQQLYGAIREGDVRYVMEALGKDPKLVNKPDFYKKFTPLHLAAFFGELDVLTLLLENGADPNNRNRLQAKTPLMLACKGANFLCVERLLEYGADVLAFESTNGRTCLHYACRNGYFESVCKVLDAAQSGPIKSTWGFTRFVNVRDANGAIPLHMAARAGHIGIVRLLLNNGALVSATTSSSTYGPGHGSTPLHCAARGGSLECVEELLAWGADRTQVDLAGHTPYVVARDRGHFACAAILNPKAAEPIVWPSPWKFMSELEPEAKSILEAALAAANNARKGSSSSGGASSNPTMMKAEVEAEPDIETGGMGVREVCCICFEQFCTIEVKDCGHQMCASCTLSLCCHNKPTPDQIPFSPPPSCPFCRQNIGQLILARPKDQQMLLHQEGKRSRSRGMRRSWGSRRRGSGRIADAIEIEQTV